MVEVTGRKFPNTDDADLDAYSIAQFCQRHGLSIATFYKLKTEMPATFRIGARVLISREAATAWRREREMAACTTVEGTAA
jgi:hypothetical protein